MPKTEYFMRDWGLKLFRNGYEPIPIAVGEKRPDFSNAKGDPDWRRIPIDEKIIQKWVSNGKAINGVGGRTATMPTLDVDCMDAKMQLEYRNRLTEEGITLGLVKWGQPPKTSYVYRTSRPFTKLTGVEWVDDKGRKAQCEFLGDGQQTVLFAVHPDTQEPYRWKNHVNPLNTRWIDLEETDADIAKRCVDIFDEMAEARGWERKRRTSGNLPARIRNNDPEWIGDDGTEPVQDLSDEQVADIVRSIENDDRFDLRDDWYRFGMAISHQLDHSELAKELFYEWSEQRPQRPGELDKVWKSIKDQDSRENITFRHIIKIHRAQTGTEAIDSAKDFIDRFALCIDDPQIEKVCDEATRVDMPPLLKNQVVDALMKAYLRLHGSKLPIADARKMVRYRRRSNDGVPKWLEDWVFLTHRKKLYNKRTRAAMDLQAFDASMTRYVMTGDSASDYALQSIKIPVYHETVFLPQEGEAYRDKNGLVWINTYIAGREPIPPDTLTRTDVRNVETIEAHFRHVFTDERDIALFTSWLAYIVKTRGKPNWAIVLQGAQGCGKTFFADLLDTMLAGDLYRLDTDTLQSSPFTSWSTGHQTVFIEELKLHGHNRFNILNKLKPYISNSVTETHKKNVDPFNTPNVTSYFAATNEMDALPLDSNDTRYFVLLSQWQGDTEIEEFKRDNPEYYRDLFSALEESPGAIRQWFLDYQLHPEFDANARAPVSHGKQRMIESNRSAEQIEIEELIDSGKHLLVSKELLVVHVMKDLLIDDNTTPLGALIENAVTLRHLLTRMGFASLGRVKIGVRDYYCWSKYPRRFVRDGSLREMITDAETL